ncbi:hypothetical protein HJG60_009671 [Phyllostomus discolor]|uniref:Uncharacterized protein n=1 Tax=Phyllostomus discolor TaxID=89673 RepID=A0A834EPR6_9CHIR|nr:hypothetical protein HJG60_009671 [Phyllostomus discolor]
MPHDGLSVSGPGVDVPAATAHAAVARSAVTWAGAEHGAEPTCPPPCLPARPLTPPRRGLPAAPSSGVCGAARPAAPLRTGAPRTKAGGALGKAVTCLRPQPLHRRVPLGQPSSRHVLWAWPCGSCRCHHRQTGSIPPARGARCCGAPDSHCALAVGTASFLRVFI